MRVLWLASLVVSIGCSTSVPLDGSSAGDVGVDASGPDAFDGNDGGAVDAVTDVPPRSDGGVSRIDAIVALLDARPADGPAIDAALHDVAMREGWPLFEGGRWLFATRIAGASTVHFTGDVDGWSTSAHPATRSATGEHFWVVIDEADFDVPAAGARYKWLVDGSDYRYPAEATAYGFDARGRFGWVRPDPAAPHLEQFPDVASAHLALPRTLRAWLPAGFVAGSAAAAEMRTLLVHDGQNVAHPDAPFGGWHIDETLGDTGRSDVVMLAVDNAADRMDAYTHVADDIGSVVGGRADDYLALLFDEALPFLRARYGLSSDPRSLMVMGSSLGGLVTLWAAAQRPEAFGCGAALSPTLGWGSFRTGAMDALITRWPAAVGHGAVALYLDSGGGVTGSCSDADADGVRDDADDADNYCVTAQMRDVLDGLGYDFGVDLSHWHEPGASHDEAAWAARVDRALDACEAMRWAAPSPP